MNDDIAVIGIACRFPGASGAEPFWRLVREGVVAIGAQPDGRRGAGPSGQGGFLADADGFDAGFFGIAPRQADRMDPQQRMILELGWECLEDAGVRPGTVRGDRTGVFVGVMGGDFAELAHAEAATPETLAGLTRGMIANRLSHHLGLTGPSLVVDTGQSSSLVAVHLAAESLRRDESRTALAGGVNLILGERGGTDAAAFGGLSATGHSRPFDASADGFVRGEGGALVLLKPYAAARADGDRVYCVLRGSAMNHDGAPGPMTVPDPQAQADVLGRAWALAGVRAGHLGYLEAHGTGTRVGDRVEAQGLHRAREASGPGASGLRAVGSPGVGRLAIGSVKANIGHLEGAAGIAGLVRTVLAIHHATIPPTAGFAEPPPDLPLAAWELRVPTEASPWPGRRVAGVSSFGMGGANCHVVLAEAPSVDSAPVEDVAGPLVFALSGPDPEALRDLAAGLRAELAGHPGPPLRDIAWTLARARTVFDHRAAVVAEDAESLLRGLDRVADGASGVVAGPGDWPAARAYVRGEPWDPAPGRLVSLPTYPFRHATASAAPAVPAPVPDPAVDSAFGTLQAVRGAVAEVLGYPDTDRIDPDAAFTDLGLDSMASVELTELLGDRLGRLLDASLVYDHPTPRAVAAALTSDEVAPSVSDPGTGSGPIAIVGIGCRYPGGIATADDLWRFVAADGDAIGGFPADRGWAGEGRGGFLTEATDFDADFFGISPREALAMDPQQRLLLEVCWEAVESSGLDPHELRGTRTGVFTGVIPQQYDNLLDGAREDLTGYVYTGTTPSVLAGRIAYALGLEGPALAVDTACSSSLVALHLAVRALRAGECTVALAGGVTVMSTPWMFREFTKQGALSPDGRSKAFAAAADGTGWAEGAGVLLLMPATEAAARGLTVLAVIRGSAVNEDGASNGLTAPNGPAQQRVIRAALADAGLAPADVDAVEAHGPGTTLGDPIEANALLATYGAAHTPDHPLWLGSVKSNLGHTQAAAGVAGVIKMVQALRRETLPATQHVDAPSRHIDWSAGTVQLLTRERPWPEGATPRRAGVSGFGAGGTNAHVVLESAPAAPEAAVAARATHAWPLSARTPEALAAQARRLAEHLAEAPEEPGAVAAALARRPRFEYRAVATGATLTDLLHGLETLTPTADSRAADGAVFVFPGQGSQWPAMARHLLAEPVFAATAADCAAAFAAHLDWSVLDVLHEKPGAASLDRVDVVQPVLFTVMVALARTWQAAGVRPVAVVGHSQGEIAAAHVAGILDLTDATRIIAVRSRAMVAFAGRGGMAAITLAEPELAERLSRFDGRLEIAAVNGSRAITVGGDPDALTELLAELDEAGVSYRRLPTVTNAGHTAQIEPLRESLLAALAPTRSHPATVPFFSTVTGGRYDGPLDAEYWWNNARRTVRFADALHALADHRFLIEVSPHPLLQAAIADELPDAALIPTLRRDNGDFLLALAGAARHGSPVRWPYPAGARAAVLPTYPFQRRRFWPTPGHRPRGTGHPLIDAVLPLPHSGGALLTATVDDQRGPWLADHSLAGEALVPGTLILEWALEAATRAGTHVTELVLEQPLSALGVREIQVVAERGELTVHSREADGEWRRHAHGSLGAVADAGDTGLAWPPAGEEVDLTDGYRTLASAGYEYGPGFRNLHRLWRDGDDLFAEVAVDDPAASRYGLHPALLDAVLHAALLGRDPGAGAVMPFAWHDVRLHRRGAVALHARLTPDGPDGHTLVATDPAGRLVITGRLTWRPAPTTRYLHRLEWTPVTLPRPSGRTAAIVVRQPVHSGEIVPALHRALADNLRTLREHLGDRDGAPLVLVTTRATGDRPDPVAAAVAALWRSAAAENPDRLRHVDTDGSAASEQAIPAALAGDRPQLALRGGSAYAPRLRPVPPADRLTVAAGPVRLAAHGGTLDGLALEPDAGAERPLRPGEIRVAVRATGLNFVDVITSMGLFPGDAGLGREFAGLVTDCGAGVDDLRPGDRVLGIVGLADSAVATTVITDHRLAARMPAGWTYAQAAGVPIAFLTAYHGLVELAGLSAGDRLLIHAATGGVGLAALQIARAAGAEVFATAHPDKWPLLRSLEVPSERLASSRTAEFADRFHDLDVVLNSLTGELIDASARTLRPGGRLLEMGKLDIRDAAGLPGLEYRPFDVLSLEPDHIAALLRELLDRFDRGELRPLPIATYELAAAPEAFRIFRDARHTGKLVLTLPGPGVADGTVLITGGTGALGGEVARHLVREHGVRSLLLVSRSGPSAPGAADLVRDLEAAGAAVLVRAHDLSDPAQVDAALASVPPAQPLSAVVHAAGVLRDGLIGSLTDEDVDAVLGPKADAAWYLHERTRDLDLADFRLFSSVTGTLPAAGQGNYAAANAFLDALAVDRAGTGLPARSLAWGLWEQSSTMSAHLNDRDRARMAALSGAPLTTMEALTAYDTATARSEPALVVARTPAAFTAPAAASSASAAEIKPWDSAEALTGWLAEQAAAVLRMPDPAAFGERALRDTGFDSLTSVELRNRINAATGLRLPVTVVFEYPSVPELSAHIYAQLHPATTTGPEPDLDQLLDLIDAELDGK